MFGEYLALRPKGFMDTDVAFFGKSLPAEQNAASEALHHPPAKSDLDSAAA
jgi:hypothetical protein